MPKLSKYSLAILLTVASAFAQPWSGILSSARAVDWRNAGAVPGSPGILPDAAWTQCGSPIAAYGTSGTPASPSTINTAISGCSSGTYVSLGSGTFYLNAGIVLKSKVVVRGQGANSTFIIFSGETGCQGFFSEFCLAGSNNSVAGVENSATWTAGFSSGTTSITISNSLNIVANSTFITLDQQNEATDTGNIWNCVTSNSCGGSQSSGGFLRTSGTCGTGTATCNQQQQVLVTGCSPSCNNAGSTVLTISPGLYAPNWASGKSTGAWWATTTAQQMGVENLSADLTGTTAGTSTVIMYNCFECWVSGIRSIDAARNHIWTYLSPHATVMNNYLVLDTVNGTSSYALEVTSSSDALHINNICTQVVECVTQTGPGEGNVEAYNYAPVSSFGGPGGFAAMAFDHSGGDQFWLREGTFANGYASDDIHGTHHMTTLFRNVFPGSQPLCGGASCTDGPAGIYLNAGSRYFNAIGNVLGSSTLTQYSSYATATPGFPFYAPIVAGFSDQNGATGFCSNPACSSSTADYDPLTETSLMLWGNWDTITNATRFCTANATPISACTGDERAGSFQDTTGIPSSYAGLATPSTTFPASFVFVSKPSFMGSLPWPVIGPDVTSGNMGICSGGTYAGLYATSSGQCTGGTLATAYAGHANTPPSMNCYLNVMGGVPDGSGSALTFNANTCYVSSGTGTSIIGVTINGGITVK